MRGTIETKTPQSGHLKITLHRTDLIAQFGRILDNRQFMGLDTAISGICGIAAVVIMS